MNSVIYMQNLLNKIKLFLKWLFKWLKYIIILVIGFIYSLFKKDDISKIAQLKEKTKPNNKAKDKIIFEISSENHQPLIKNSVFHLTVEKLKEEIVECYCNEKRIKKYELTKEDDKLIDELEIIILPIIEEEFLKKNFTPEEKLKEEIKKLINDELLKLEKQKTPSIAISQEILNSQKEDMFNSNHFNPTPSFIDERKNSSSLSKNPEIKNPPIKQETSKLEKKIVPKDITVPNTSMKVEKITDSANPKKASSKSFIPPIAPLTFPNNEVLESMQPNTETLKEKIKEEKKESDILEKKNNQEKEEETKPKEEKQNKKKETEFIMIDLSLIENKIKELEFQNTEIQKKQDLEEKNYDEHLQKINLILKEIENLKVKKLKPEDQRKLLEKEIKLKNIKEKLEQEKEKDLEKEKNDLEESITEKEISGLLEELQKLHFENQIDLNEYFINKAEDLENLSEQNLKKIEKALIKTKIKKASKTLELPSILLLPFIRNRYFFLFTAGLFVNNHLNILDNLLKHKSVNYTEPNLEHIKKGSDALEEALQLTTINISYLNNLEQEILHKYPELSIDEEYLLYINKLRYSLLKNEEKMLKKKKMIKKYNLKYQAKVRKLKKVS